MHLIVLVLSWIAYGALHSVTASMGFKQAFQQRFPDAFHTYRLLFNITATLLLLIPLWLLWSYKGEPLWHWPNPISLIATIIALLAILGFLYSLSLYDGSDFLGLKQLKEARHSITEPAPMSLSWLHRYVRHPLYFFGLVIIWLREMNAAWLVSAICLTLYLIIGSRFEERKLVNTYGEQYRRYMKKVPGLIPLPWQFLSKPEAEALLISREKTD